MARRGRHSHWVIAGAGHQSQGTAPQCFLGEQCTGHHEKIGGSDSQARGRDMGSQEAEALGARWRGMVCSRQGLP